MTSGNHTQKFLSPDALRASRALFPFTETARIYLNHASTSPLSIRVVDATIGYLRERSVGELDLHPRDQLIITECRALVQKLINAESPDRIALVGNTSDALNIVASGIPWKSGDRILLNDIEFPANVYPYLHLKRLGVELDILSPPDGRVTTEMVERSVKPRTKLVALSAVQFLSGHRADLDTLGSLCRSRGILFVIDGIQAVGAVRIDVQRMKIDALAAGSQKWQMGPQGTGFLYVTEELQKLIQPAHLGWLSPLDPWDFRNYGQPLASSARRYEVGTLNIPGLWGLRAALSTLLEFGPETTESHILAITRILINRFQQTDGVELFSPAADDERAGIVTIGLQSPLDAGKAFEEISGQNIAISLREGKLRFSPHFYNSPEEMETTAEVLRECLKGQFTPRGVSEMTGTAKASPPF